MYTRAEKAVRRSSVVLRDLNILEEKRHAVSGARLILAYNNASKKYLTGWTPVWRKGLSFYDTFTREVLAGASYDFQKRKKPPQRSDLTRDFQRTLLYQWETAFLGEDTRGLNLEQLNKTVERIAADFNIEPPDFYYVPKGKRTGDETVLGLYSPYLRKGAMMTKKINYVLHEMAHDIDRHLNKNEWSPHGPSFLRTLIFLADRYHFYWTDADTLERTAEKVGLFVAPKSVITPKWNPLKNVVA